MNRVTRKTLLIILALIVSYTAIYAKNRPELKPIKTKHTTHELNYAEMKVYAKTEIDAQTEISIQNEQTETDLLAQTENTETETIEETENTETETLEITEETNSSKEPEIKTETEQDKETITIEDKNIEPKPESKEETKKIGGLTKEERDKLPLFDIHISYSPFMPILEYKDRYNAGNMVSAGIGLYRFNLYGIAPEFIFRYTNMKSKDSNNYVNSEFNMFQFSFGIIYRAEIPVPINTRKHPHLGKKVTIFARITEGATLLRYDADYTSTYHETVNTLGISIGATYPVYKMLHIGIDVGYKIIFTAGDYMQGMMLNFIVGVRV